VSRRENGSAKEIRWMIRSGKREEREKKMKKKGRKGARARNEHIKEKEEIKV